MTEAVPDDTAPPDAEDVEVELFIEALRRAHGYDYSGYLRASFKRRLQALAARKQAPDISSLIGRMLRDPAMLPEIISGLSVPHSGMFRDPGVFARLRGEVLPALASHPRLTVWHAGCAGGEEAYSLAIVLHELGLMRRSRIYATDISDGILALAREGIYPLREARQYAENYLAAGGTASFSDYMHAQYGGIKMHDWLRAPMTFATHNLTADGVFVEAQLVLCRNVFIYFDAALRRRALQLFADSLVRGGYLLLGLREAVDRELVTRWFEPLGDGLYRRHSS